MNKNRKETYANDANQESARDQKFWPMDTDRRSFLKIMGAQLMMLSLAGCTRAADKIIPYVKSPEEIIPGKSLYFASTLSFDGFARGVLVESNMGRPTKIEGNPDHPDSLGATDAVTQGMIYQLYDPQRLHSVQHQGVPALWDDFKNALRPRLEASQKKAGEGLRILSRPIISPALSGLKEKILQEYPAAQWHQYSPINRDNARQAYSKIYGRDLQAIYNLEKADTILTIQSDFLVQGPGALAYARQFSRRREIDSPPANLIRIYALESTPTLTGAMADHRWICHPSQIEYFLSALIDLINGNTRAGKKFSGEWERELDALAEDLRKNRGRSLVVAGAEQSAGTHILTDHLNDILQNRGKTIRYIQSIEDTSQGCLESIKSLAEDLQQGKVSDLIILGGNPVYTTPYELRLDEKIPKAKFSAYLGMYDDETARLSNWVIPLAHELESWGDGRAFDGTVSIRQPLIDPLFNGVTEYEICIACLNMSALTSREYIQEFWKQRAKTIDFNSFWHKTLRDGIMAETAYETITVKTPDSPPLDNNISISPEWTLLVRPDPHISDGRFSNNSWLQELPKPLTKLSWENAALIAPVSARENDLKDGDIITITVKNNSVDAPVYILPGQAPRVMTIYLGYGRNCPGQTGNAHGFNAFRLQLLSEPDQTEEFHFKKTGRQAALTTTQHHSILREERNLVIAADLERFSGNPFFVREIIRAPKRSETLYKPEEHLKGEYQWGMCIDLNLCTGCGACTIACQVENNIAVVGKEEVRRSRAMHWIRVDRYYKGPPDAPEIYHQPIPCMHCEDAPCELVCPVKATSHSNEGLNQMTYNRCIGTRYCSNNCPYKVRRFSFFEYTDFKSGDLLQAKNPNVTIRSRGVMEKCTYCIQRINRVRIAAKKENRKIREGEVLTACQQVCPTQAISFGNIRDKNSKIFRRQSGPLNYGLLSLLGTRPRTSYLARIKNPNPMITSKVG